MGIPFGHFGRQVPDEFLGLFEGHPRMNQVAAEGMTKVMEVQVIHVGFLPDGISG
jgi:hypothetical protein